MLRNICVTHDHGYVPLVLNIPRSFPHSWLIIEFETRVTRREPLVEQELLTIPEHMSSPSVFSGVCVARSLVFCVVFCRLLFVLFSLSLVIELSALRFTDSYYYLFGIFKFCQIFLSDKCTSNSSQICLSDKCTLNF